MAEHLGEGFVAAVHDWNYDVYGRTGKPSWGVYCPNRHRVHRLGDNSGFINLTEEERVLAKILARH